MTTFKQTISSGLWNSMEICDQTVLIIVIITKQGWDQLGSAWKFEFVRLAQSITNTSTNNVAIVNTACLIHKLKKKQKKNSLYFQAATYFNCAVSVLNAQFGKGTKSTLFCLQTLIMPMSMQNSGNKTLRQKLYWLELLLKGVIRKHKHTDQRKTRYW